MTNKDIDDFADIIGIKPSDHILFISVNKIKDLEDFIQYGKYVDVVRSKRELKKRIIYDMKYEKIVLEFNPRFHDIETILDCILLNSKGGLFNVIGNYTTETKKIIENKFPKANNWTFESAFGTILVSTANGIPNEKN